MDNRLVKTYHNANVMQLVYLGDKLRTVPTPVVFQTFGKIPSVKLKKKFSVGFILFPNFDFIVKKNMKNLLTYIIYIIGMVFTLIQIHIRRFYCKQLIKYPTYYQLNGFTDTRHTQKTIEYTQIIELGNTTSSTVRTKKNNRKQF